MLAENVDTGTVNNIIEDVIVSKRNHNSILLAIIAHSKCAGNPVEKEIQINHLLFSRKRVGFFELDIPTLLLFIDVDRQTCETVNVHMASETVSIGTAMS